MKKLLHDIHLWLSIPFGIFITLICFSGAMLVFEKEITEMCHPGLYRVEHAGMEPLPLEELMQQVGETLPDSVQITGVTLYPDPGRTCQVSLSKPRRASVYVDPYTGEVVGKNERMAFFDTMFHLHRWLLGASGSDGSTSWGKLMVGVSTLMLVIILLTGILMWLTNRHRPLAAGLKISVSKGWRRFWHDLHVAGGIYATLFLLALALTGLTWSFSWYRTGFYSLFGVETASQAPQGGGDHAQRRGRAEQHHHRHSPYAHWQEVYEQLAASHPGYRQITLSGGTAGVIPQGRRSLRAADTYSFNPRSGEITACQPYGEQDKGSRMRGTVYTIHTGSWGGLLTRILTFIAALLGATLPLTGYYLWIKRLGGRKH